MRVSQRSSNVPARAHRHVAHNAAAASIDARTYMGGTVQRDYWRDRGKIAFFPAVESFWPLPAVIPRGVEAPDLPQPLIARVLGGLARRLGRGLGCALAAGNLDRLAAGDFVAGIVGHLPEEIGRYHGDDRDHDERGREIGRAQLLDMAPRHS